MLCPCGSDLDFTACCQPIHTGSKDAQTAEQLMRARYAAFSMHNIDFIYNSFHPSTRRFQQKNAIEQWAKENKWMQLAVLKTTATTVEFEAHYLDPDLNTQIHHEKSTFKQLHGRWFYLDGIIL
ncbi:YchJ family protein [Sphingobacterium sp. Mn56C]|uniref:YchJ family protein n=1 Tax=Sphingobacterium sp. Mn56C TaxID=3395261 RepID=UPI003BE7EF37